MKMPDPEAYNENLDRIIGYFDPTVLAAYRAEPDKYEVNTDFFEGEVRTTDSHYASLDEAARSAAYIGVRFGFRTLYDGSLALAAYLPDLIDRSDEHLPRWQGFLIREPHWSDYGGDERFKRWVQRSFEGSWDVDNGPAHYLAEGIRLINGLTKEAVGSPLFDLAHEPHIDFPSAQNSHRYQDAHRELYRLLHDALDKDCIERLGRRIGRPVNAKSSKTMAALRDLLPSINADVAFTSAMDKVSEERRKASHKQRPPAVPFKAFEAFTGDLTECVRALTLLRVKLEQELGMDAEHSTNRQDALSRLVRIDRPPESNYSINGARRMIGRTVSRVECGFRRHIDGVHQSEALILHFDDGSIMSLDTGSNAVNLMPGHAESFHVDLHIDWVPPVRRKDD